MSGESNSNSLITCIALATTYPMVVCFSSKETKSNFIRWVVTGGFFLWKVETLIKHNKTKQIYIDGFDKSQRNNTLRKKREIKGNEISALVIVVVVIGFLFLKSNKTVKLIETDKYKSLAQK